jgi:hypothetical protein
MVYTNVREYQKKRTKGLGPYGEHEIWDIEKHPSDLDEAYLESCIMTATNTLAHYRKLIIEFQKAVFKRNHEMKRK